MSRIDEREEREQQAERDARERERRQRQSGGQPSGNGAEDTAQKSEGIEKGEGFQKGREEIRTQEVEKDYEITDPQVPQPQRQAFVLEELIRIPEGDMSPLQIGRHMKQVAKVCSYIVSQLTRVAATDRPRVAGLGHPIAQAILQCAIQADAAAMALEPQQILPPNDAPTPRLMPNKRQ